MHHATLCSLFYSKCEEEKGPCQYAMHETAPSYYELKTKSTKAVQTNNTLLRRSYGHLVGLIGLMAELSERVGQEPSLERLQLVFVTSSRRRLLLVFVRGAGRRSSSLRLGGLLQLRAVVVLLRPAP